MQTEVEIPSQVELVLSIRGDPYPLSCPSDVDIGPACDVYIVDSENDRIQVFDSSGAFLRMWGATGSRLGEMRFRDPGGGNATCGIALDEQGNVFVTDSSNRRVQRFDRIGRFITAWVGIDEEDSQALGTPVGVAVDRQGNVYVTDLDRQAVFKTNREGDVLVRWGERGVEDGQFNQPLFVFVDLDRNVYVADWGNHRIQKFDDQGTFISAWGTEGAGDGELSYTNDAALDA